MIIWSVTEKSVCCLQGQGHCQCFYDKNMTISAISSKLLIRLGLMVHHYKPEYRVKIFIAVLKAKVTGKAQNVIE